MNRYSKLLPRVYLSTAFMLMMVAGFLLMFNFHNEWLYDGKVFALGWPYPAYFIEPCNIMTNLSMGETIDPGFFWLGVILNLLTGFVILAFTGMACESTARRAHPCATVHQPVPNGTIV